MKKKRLRVERGAAAVEFAMIAVVFLMIVFGIIEFGILMFDKHVLTNASREGARAGIVMRVPRLPDEDIQNIVIKYAEEHMVSFGASSTLDFGPWPDGPDEDVDPDVWITPAMPDRVGLLFGKELKITVKYPFNFLVLSGFGLDPITLTAETRMRME
jgi:hypothetical protein